MGLLDEAIREHLELKRLRGADPVDVARMEREALGPARRPDSEPDRLPEPGTSAEAPFDAEPTDSGASLAGPRDGEAEHEPLGADAGGAVADFGPAPPSSSVYDDEPARASGYGGDLPAPASYAEEAPPEPADWSDRDIRPPEPPFGDEHEHGAGAPTADDRSIAPASYGQETAEFDVESAVLGHEPGAPSPPGAAPGPHAADVADVADVAEEPPIAPPPAPDEPGPYGEVMGERELTEEPAADETRRGETHSAETERPALIDEPTQLHPAAAPPAPETEPVHPAPAPARGQGEPAAELEPEEDVLEETPDFLQETPEHERLWFEQRPPRDFDFDK